jgi:hypothetical protein
VRTLVFIFCIHAIRRVWLHNFLCRQRQPALSALTRGGSQTEQSISCTRICRRPTTYLILCARAIIPSYVLCHVARPQRHFRGFLIVSVSVFTPKKAFNSNLSHLQLVLLLRQTHIFPELAILFVFRIVGTAAT